MQMRKTDNYICHTMWHMSYLPLKSYSFNSCTWQYVCLWQQRMFSDKRIRQPKKIAGKARWSILPLVKVHCAARCNFFDITLPSHLLMVSMVAWPERPWQACGISPLTREVEEHSQSHYIHMLAFVSPYSCREWGIFAHPNVIIKHQKITFKTLPQNLEASY